MGSISSDIFSTTQLFTRVIHDSISWTSISKFLHLQIGTCLISPFIARR